MVFKEVARLIGGRAGNHRDLQLRPDWEGGRKGETGGQRETGNVYVVCLQAGIDG